MDKNTLHNVLNDLAKQEIPDTMNLWKDIEKRLPAAHKRPSARPALRLSTAVLTLVVALAFVTGAYAVYQSQVVNGDPGIVSAGAEALITPLELTQSHPDADVDMVLHWGYADGNRIAVEWMVRYKNTYYQPGIGSIELYDAEGNAFNGADFIRGGGGGGGGDGESSIFGSVASWDSTHITDNPENINLTVVLTLTSEPTSLSGFNGGGGGGGGEGGGLPVLPEATEEPERSLVPPHEFSFDITLPFIPAVEGVVESITVTAADIPITLSDIRYAPSVTLGKICIPVGYFSQYGLRLANDGYGQYFSTSQEVERSEDGTVECDEFSVLGLLADDEGWLKLDILRFVSTAATLTDERWAAFEAAVEEAGLPVNVQRFDEGFGMSWDVDSYPIDRAYEERFHELMDTILYDSIPGPWVFEIPLK